MHSVVDGKVDYLRSSETQHREPVVEILKDNSPVVMSSIQLTELELLSSNPGYFGDAFQWRVRLYAVEELPDPISIAFYWVGSARTAEFDQLLEEFEIGPLTLDGNEVVLDHSGPDLGLIPPEDLFEISGMYIVFSYHGTAFLRVAYYTKVAFWDETMMRNPPPPSELSLDMIGRSVLMQRPMVTTYAVDWESFAAGTA